MILMMADSGAASGCGGWRVCKKILFQNLSQVVLSRATAMGKMGGLGSNTRRTDKAGWYWQSNARKSYSVVDIRSINFGVAVDTGTVQSDLVPWPTQIDRPDFFLLSLTSPKSLTDQARRAQQWYHVPFQSSGLLGNGVSVQTHCLRWTNWPVYSQCTCLKAPLTASCSSLY